MITLKREVLFEFDALFEILKLLQSWIILRSSLDESHTAQLLIWKIALLYFVTKHNLEEIICILASFKICHNILLYDAHVWQIFRESVEKSNDKLLLIFSFLSIKIIEEFENGPS